MDEELRRALKDAAWFRFLHEKSSAAQRHAETEATVASNAAWELWVSLEARGRSEFDRAIDEEVRLKWCE